MKKVTILGAGMIGSAIAADLTKEYLVTVADINSVRLNELKEKLSVQTVPADLSNTQNIPGLIKDSDLVIGAVPGFMGFKTLEAVIKAGKNVVDISFFDENPFKLHKLAKENNITAVVDCGVAPGLSNIILGYHNSRMTISEFECMVGGLPFKRTWPYQYKAPFSPIDVIEEYTRPARIIKDGQEIILPALSESEFVEIDPVGTLEAFNTDGLRSLIKTMDIPHMKEKTLRYPGHIEYIRVLIDSGFFSREEIEINGIKVKPIDVTAKLLFPKWQLEKDEKEFTVMRIIIRGTEDGKKVEHIYNLYDQFDEKTQVSSMARTTGYTCTAAARLVLNGDFKRKGICPPEYIGAEEGCFGKVMKHLSDRNINASRHLSGD
ncbi:MAG: saccharopine dehydrogenase C-terminal domain-containing protein [Ignavibacteriaceae bacterium]